MELCQVALIILGGYLPGGKVFFWRKPGACHKARFMAFAIYAFKLLAFSSNPVVIEECFSIKGGKKSEVKKQLELLRRFCHYAVSYYVPMFLTASRGADAAVNDLKLFKSLDNFKNIDKELAVQAQKTLCDHLWYLTPTTVLFSLFSKKISVEDKSRIASRLLTMPRNAPIKFGKPVFPTLKVNTQLWDLVSSESWQFFDIVRISSDWLTLPPAEWSKSEDFKIGEHFVNTTKVVNDTAERGVRLASDYIGILTMDSVMRQKVFQVVEWDRRQRPDRKKSTINQLI